MRQQTEAAKAKTQIQQMLRTTFPSVKFKVKVKNSSLTDGLYIDWIDGPPQVQVYDKVKKYETNSGFKELPQVDTIIVTRVLSQ